MAEHHVVAGPEARQQTLHGHCDRQRSLFLETGRCLERVEPLLEPERAVEVPGSNANVVLVDTIGLLHRQCRLGDVHGVEVERASVAVDTYAHLPCVVRVIAERDAVLFERDGQAVGGVVSNEAAGFATRSKRRPGVTLARQDVGCG